MTQISLRFAISFCALPLALLITRQAVAAEAPQINSLPPALLQSDSLGEELELLKPDNPREEAAQDQIHAAGLYAHGRMLQNRGELPAALQRFERAWRYHPRQVSILDSIVALSFELKRNGEAARYAVIAAERNPKDSAMLRRLAVYLTQQQDYKRATALYQKAVELAPPNGADVSQLFIQQELSKLYLLQEEYQKAAEAAVAPADALENPKKYDLTENFLKALLGKPEQTYRMFGESFVRGGMYDRAEKAFRKAHEAEKNQQLLDYSLARVEAGKGNDKQALKLLNQYFDADGSSGGLEAYELYAELISKKETDENNARQQILERLQPLREKDPANAALGIFVAGQLMADSQYGAAEKVYRDLLDVAPSLEVFSGMIALEHERGDAARLLDALGSAVARAGDFDPVEEAVKPILEDKELLAKLVAEGSQRLEGKQVLGEGVALAAGLLALEAEAFDKVKPFMQQALEEGLPTKAAVVSNWGLSLLIGDQNEEAAETFQMAIDEKIAPDNNAAFYYYLGSALGMSDQFDEAIEAAEKAAELRPTARFKSRVPWLHYYAKDYDKSVAKYKELLEEYDDQFGDPDTRDVVSGVRSILSAIAVKEGRIEEAIEHLERVLDEFPEDIGAHNDLGYLWADQNIHLNRAHSMIRVAVADQPENKAYRDSLGWILFRLGKLDEAIAELEIAADEEDPDGVILDHLADAYAAAGKTGKAKGLWQRAVTAFEKSEESDMAEKVRQKLADQDK